MLVPPSIQRSSKVRVVAPSGPFERVLFWRAIGWLADFCKPHFDPKIFDKDGFLAGSDARRRAEFQDALDDPDASAIIVARGGWGAARFSQTLDFSGLLSHPKWLVGFSDPTTLHLNAWRLGVASMHASNLVALGRGDSVARTEWLDALRFPLKRRTLPGVAASPGRASGPLVGGNLTVLACALSAGHLSLPEGCILALEDVTESSYRIDRMLSTLESAGLFDQVAAIALGEFTDCDPGVHSVPTAQVLRRHLLPLGIPVVTDLPFGHGRVNRPLLFGIRAEIDGTRGELHLGI